MIVKYGRGFEVEKSHREKVCNLQAIISTLPQYEPVTEHLFHGGVYCRKVFQKADATIVGKVHKKDHFFFVLDGTLIVSSEDGAKTITGPAFIKSNPGTKRAIYSVTDSTYMTIHSIETTSLEDAESELVEDDPLAMFGVGNVLKTQSIEV